MRKQKLNPMHRGNDYLAIIVCQVIVRMHTINSMSRHSLKSYTGKPISLRAYVHMYNSVVSLATAFIRRLLDK